MTVKSSWLSLQSLKDFLSPDTKMYTKSKPQFHQAHLTEPVRDKKTNVYETSLASLPKAHVQWFGAVCYVEPP